MQSRSESNPHESAARAAKVTGLLLALSRLPQFPTADEMVDWGAPTWELLAKCAGVNPPSQATIDALIGAVRAHEQAPRDFALSPLETWMAKPGRSVVAKHLDGQSIVSLTEHGRNVTHGVGRSLGEAFAHAMNNVFAIQWADTLEVAS